MTPARVQILIREAIAMKLEENLTLMAIVNRGFTGGDGYKELSQSIRRELSELE